MKNLKLIIALWIIFIIGVIVLVKVNAQEKVEKHPIVIKWDDVYKGLVIIQLDMETDTITVYQNFTAMVMLSLLREYSAECYADSELVKMGLFYTFEGNKFKAIYDPKPYESIGNLIEVNDEWIHRDPTFTGFMEFLEAKYKQ